MEVSMARNVFDDWIPEEFDSDVVQRVNQVSVVERWASRIPMGSDTKQVARSAGVDVEFIAKGGVYGEDSSTNTDVTLIARKFGKAIRVAEEDIDDSLPALIAAKQRDWATSYAKALDNACLGTTAAQGAGVPFDSLYRSLTQTNAETGYTGNANVVQAATATGVTYTLLSQVLKLVENSDYFDLPRMRVVAHPSFRDDFRLVRDTAGNPIFIQGLSGTPDTLFGIPVGWSLGAKTSATMLQSPNGLPLLFVVNADYLRLGIRSGPESVFIDGRAGLGALTDESILKLRARRGFAVGHEAAAAVLVKL
jgi:HK97 family phage major capsid protein